MCCHVAVRQLVYVQPVVVQVSRIATDSNPFCHLEYATSKMGTRNETALLFGDVKPLLLKVWVMTVKSSWPGV